MSGKQLPPEIEREMGRLKQRVSNLERVLGEASTLQHDPGLPFTLGGGLYVSESPPWTPRAEVRIVEIVALLGTAGTSTTTVQVRKNGTPIATLTLGPGETFRRATFSATLAANQDLLTVAITGAGSGAADLDVIVRLR